MKNLNVIKSGWAKAGVVLLLAVPSVNFADNSFNKYQTTFGNELARTQSLQPNANGQVGPQSQAQADSAALEELLGKLKSDKEVDELDKKIQAWEKVSSDYQNIDKRVNKAVETEAKKRIGEDKVIEAGVKQINNSVAPVAPQVAANMASKDCPTKLNTGDASQVLSSLQGLDTAAKYAQTNLSQFAQEDEAKANEVFEAGRKAQLLKAIAPTPADPAAPQIPPEVIEAIRQATKGKFNLFAEQLKKVLVAKKYKAQDVDRIVTAQNLLGDDGALARLNKMKRNDPLVADTVTNMTTFFNGQIAQVSGNMLKQIKANQDTCIAKFDEIERKKKATVANMNMANVTGSAFFDQNQFTAEQRRYSKTLSSREDCEIQAEQAMQSFNANIKTAMDTLQQETKNPIKVRDNIMNVYSVIANESVQVASQAQPILNACTFASNELKKIEQDQTRTQLAQGNGQGPVPQGAAQGALPRRQGGAQPAPGLASQGQPAHIGQQAAQGI